MITVLPRGASLGCSAGRLAKRPVNPLYKCFTNASQCICTHTLFSARSKVAVEAQAPFSPGPRVSVLQHLNAACPGSALCAPLRQAAAPGPPGACRRLAKSTESPADWRRPRPSGCGPAPELANHLCMAQESSFLASGPLALCRAVWRTGVHFDSHFSLLGSEERGEGREQGRAAGR